MILFLIFGFVVLTTFPFLYGRMNKATGARPELIPPPGGEKACIESAQYMREHHVEILKKWRDSVVRDGINTYHARDGKEYTASLSDTCIRCHSNKEQFCNRCHDYVRANPGCWDCHVSSQGIK